MNLDDRKFMYESAVAHRLLGTVAWPYTDVSDPKVIYGKETGADVHVRLEGGRVGIQVTDLCIDEDGRSGGSRLRQQEAADAAEGKFPVSAVPLNWLDAMLFRVRAKIERARLRTFEEFDDVWLLVAASIPAPDRVKATFVLPYVVEVEDLNRHLNVELTASKYAKVLLHLHLNDMVYEWTRGTNWHHIHGEPYRRSGGELEFKKHFQNDELMRDPVGWARREAQRVLDELRGFERFGPRPG